MDTIIPETVILYIARGTTSRQPRFMVAGRSEEKIKNPFLITGYHACKSGHSNVVVGYAGLHRDIPGRLQVEHIGNATESTVSQSVRMFAARLNERYRRIWSGELLIGTAHRVFKIRNDFTIEEHNTFGVVGYGGEIISTQLAFMQEMQEDIEHVAMRMFTEKVWGGSRTIQTCSFQRYTL